MVAGAGDAAGATAARGEASREPLMLVVEDADMIDGFAAGGDDYVNKPFSLKVLAARVRALLAREERLRRAARGSVLHVDDDLSVGFGRMAVAVRGANVPLARKNYEILALLAKHPGQVFDRDMICEQVWGEPGDESVVTEHVRRLRRALEQAEARRPYVRTVWGTGYAWEA